MTRLWLAMTAVRARCFPSDWKTICPRIIRSEREAIIDLVSTSRPDRFDRPRSDPFLRNHFAMFEHHPLVLFAER